MIRHRAIVAAAVAVGAAAIVVVGPSSAAAQAAPGTQVAAGSTFTCVLLDPGVVHCWGNNNSGQLGDGSRVWSPTPVRVVGISGVRAITAGNNHACALLADGTVRCWGSNASGQLGNGISPTADSDDLDLSPVPVPVVGLTGVTAISAGRAHTCAVLGDGTARCWGSNANGQLGNGSRLDSAVPETVSGLTGATAVTAGGSHSCAVAAGGAVWCWGYNNAGQLGDTTRLDAPVPVDVTGLTGATAVTAGDLHTCAVATGGGVRCWGSNSNGQLGNGLVSSVPATAPVAVIALTGATAVDAGDTHTCALAGGLVRCWGAGWRGQLGESDPPYDPATGPNTVAGISGATDVDAGSAHTCAALASGPVQCWGANDSAQLGDASGRSSSRPVTVIGFGSVAMASTMTGYRVIPPPPPGSTRPPSRGSHPPAGDPDGYGGVTLQVSPNLATATSQVCWTATVANVALPATGARLHRAAKGNLGPEVFVLTPPGADGRTTGCLSVSTRRAMDLVMFAPDYNVTVANADFPAGALRGNLTRVEREGTLLAASLAVRAPTGRTPEPVGAATMTLNGSRLCWQIEVTGVLDGRASSLHIGEPGVEGPTLINFWNWNRHAYSAGCLNVSDPFLRTDLIAQPGRYYVNVTTASAPTGLLRGNFTVVPTPPTPAPEPSPAPAAGVG